MKITIEHPSSEQIQEGEIGPHGTPQELIEDLLGLGNRRFLKPLPSIEAEYGLMNQRTQTRLLRDQPLSAQGVADGDRLRVTMESKGAAPTVERLQLDIDSLPALVQQDGCITNAAVYTDGSRQRRVQRDNPSVARVFVVEYRIPVLIDKKHQHDRFVVQFDITPIFDRYPSEVGDRGPKVTVISNPKPWHHRVSSGGSFCIGVSPGKHYLIGDYAVRVARLLNFDEPFDRIKHDTGYTPEAYNFYMKKWGGRPVNPHLNIPEITHRAFKDASGRGFKPSKPKTRFVPTN